MNDRTSERTALATVPVEPDADGRTQEMTVALESVYQFREPEVVRAFLVEHPELLNIAWEAATVVPQFLPAAAPIVLEVVRDPEDAHDGGLFAVVPTAMEPEEIRPRRGQLIDEWLLDASRRAGGRFNVAVEYR